MLFMQSNVGKRIWIEYAGWDNGKVRMVSCFIPDLNILGQLKLIQPMLKWAERRRYLFK